MLVIVREHHIDRPDRLTATTPEAAAAWQRNDAHAKPPRAAGEWVATPPADSDWERAEWEALAQRAGVA